MQADIYIYIEIKEKLGFARYTLKGQFNEIFYPQFFHHSNRPGPLTNGLKYFRFWFRFRQDIHIFSEFRAVSYCAESSFPQDQTVRSKVLHMPYCAESSSVQYHTAWSQSLKFVVKAPRSIILRGVMQQNLRGKLRTESYCVESLYTVRCQRLLFETFAQAFNGTVS